jgi:hypothetical protein
MWAVSQIVIMITAPESKRNRMKTSVLMPSIFPANSDTLSRSINAPAGENCYNTFFYKNKADSTSSQCHNYCLIISNTCGNNSKFQKVCGVKLVKTEIIKQNCCAQIRLKYSQISFHYLIHIYL